MMISPPSQEVREFPPEIPKKVLARLLQRTTFVGDCWLFSATNARGHGQLSYGGRTWGVHRLIAHFCYGLDLFDSKQQANHIVECPYRNCWDPKHIYVGTQSQNLKDAIEVGTYVSPQAKKTHCPRGHLLGGDNLAPRKDGGRECRICRDERSRDWYNNNKK